MIGVSFQTFLLNCNFAEMYPPLGEYSLQDVSIGGGSTSQLEIRFSKSLALRIRK